MGTVRRVASAPPQAMRTSRNSMTFCASMASRNAAQNGLNIGVAGWSSRTHNAVAAGSVRGDRYAGERRPRSTFARMRSDRGTRR